MLEGIPIVVDRTPVPSSEPVPLGRGPDHYWNDWDEIPGGAACYIGESTHTITWGSLCTPVDDDGDTKMITAGHLVDEQDREWASATNPEENGDFDVDQIKCTGGTGIDVFDAATLDDRSGVEMTHEFAEKEGVKGGEIRGVIHEEHLRNIEDNGTDRDTTFMRQGAATGRDTEFGIDKIGREGFISTLHENKTKGGDSGGPYYIRKFSFHGDKYATELDIERIPEPYDLVAGIHQGDLFDKPYTVATSMYRVEEEFDVKA